MRQVDPVALEDILHLELKDLWTCENVAAQVLESVQGIVLDGALECPVDRSIEHGFHRSNSTIDLKRECAESIVIRSSRPDQGVRWAVGCLQRQAQPGPASDTVDQDAEG